MTLHQTTVIADILPVSNQCTRACLPLIIRAIDDTWARKKSTPRQFCPYCSCHNSRSNSKWLRVTPAVEVAPEPLIVQHIIIFVKGAVASFLRCPHQTQQWFEQAAESCLSAERVVVNWGGDRDCCDRVVVRRDPTLTNCKLISATVWKQFYLAV